MEEIPGSLGDRPPFTKAAGGEEVTAAEARDNDRDLAEVEVSLQTYQYANAHEALLELKKVPVDQYPTQVALAFLLSADLYELSGDKQGHTDYLAEAERIIKRYELEELASRLYVRKASWHRAYGFQDSTNYYVQSWKSTVPEESKKSLEAARAYHIEAFQIASRNFSEAQRLYRQAIALAETHGDQGALAIYWLDLAKLYGVYEKWPLYLQALRCSVQAGEKAVAAGHLFFAAVPFAYTKLIHYYQVNGPLDSLTKYNLELYQWQKNTSYRKSMNVAQQLLEARLTDDWESEQVRSRDEALRRERITRYLTVGVAVIILAFATGLAYFVSRFRKAKELSDYQATQLRQLDRAKTRFFANVSHELRTPLTLILAPMETLSLRMGNANPAAGQLIRTALRGGEVLRGLIDELLDLTKLEAGKMPFNPEPTPVMDFLQPLAAQFRAMAEFHQVTFTASIPEDPDLSLRLDREKLRRIFTNLISNATKFTSAGGSVELNVNYNDGFFSAEVKDSGSGIHPDDLPHVFDRYFQTQRPEVEATGGTGIGLALCREYVELFGGTLTVASEWGKGATFHFRFPATEVSETRHQPAVKAVADSLTSNTPLLDDISTQGANLLVVEDHPELRHYLEMILHPEYEVFTVANGAEALVRLADDRAPEIDLVLSDIMMPVMNGYTLLEKLKSQDATRGLPVIMLTARTGKEDRLHALRIGVDDFLTKPFNERELRLRIRNLLRNLRVRQELILEEVITQDGTVQAAKTPVPLPNLTAEDQHWLREFESFVITHLADDRLSVSFLAHEMAMSESTLLRQLKRLTGLTPQNYITEVRVTEAYRLLIAPPYLSPAEIAGVVGYREVRTLRRNYYKKYGKALSERMVNKQV